MTSCDFCGGHFQIEDYNKDFNVWLCKYCNSINRNKIFEVLPYSRYYFNPLEEVILEKFYVFKNDKYPIIKVYSYGGCFLGLINEFIDKQTRVLYEMFPQKFECSLYALRHIVKKLGVIK